MAIVTRINRGLYRLAHAGRVFEIEDIAQASDGDCAPGWMAYEMHGDRREFLDDYRTKRVAILSTVHEVDFPS